MTRKNRIKSAQQLSIYRTLHTVAGLVSIIFLTILAITGLFLNHPKWMADKHSHPPVATALHSSNADISYIATQKGLVEQWRDQTKKIATPYPAKNIQSILVSKDMQLYLIYKQGLILKSKASAPYRFQRLNLPADVYVIDAFSATGKTLLLQTETGLFKSQNDGQNWTLITPIKVGFKGWVKRLHTGYLPNLTGAETWLARGHDVGAILLLFLIVSGVIIYIRRLLNLNQR